MKFLIINGPNLNMLGIREPQIYGSRTYADLCGYIESICVENGVEVKIFQSNSEGAIVDEIQAAYGVFNGLIINPAAYTHTSIAIPDAIKSVCIPAVEVHISDITNREKYRQHSYTSQACIATIIGLGFDSYKEAVIKLKEFINAKNSSVL